MKILKTFVQSTLLWVVLFILLFFSTNFILEHFSHWLGGACDFNFGGGSRSLCENQVVVVSLWTATITSSLIVLFYIQKLLKFSR